jgi:O-Antigen ligase
MALLLIHRRIFENVSTAALALINVNLVGMDPPDLLIAPLTLIGLLFGHLSLRRKITPFFAVFVGTFLLLHTVADVVGSPMPNALGHFVLNCVLWLFLATFLTSVRRMRLLLIALLGGNILTTAIAAIAIAAGHSTPPQWLMFDFYRSGRFQAMFGDPNALAFFSCLLVAWLLDELLHPKLWPGHRKAKVGLIAMLFVQIAASLSRSGAVDLLVTLIVYGTLAVLAGERTAIIKLSFALITVFTVSLSVLWFTGALSAVTARADVVAAVARDPMEAQRASFYFTRRAIAVGAQHPEGVGTGRTERILATPEFSLGAHNTYIQVFADNGWGTFAAFLAAIGFLALIVLYRAIQGEPPVYGVSYRFVAAAFMGLAAAGMFHDLMFWSFAWIVPAIASAVITARHGHLAH